MCTAKRDGKINESAYKVRRYSRTPLKLALYIFKEAIKIGAMHKVI